MNTKIKDIIEILKNLLIAASRWSDTTTSSANEQNNEYKGKREELLKIKEVENYLPSYIKSNIDLKMFNSSIKSEISGQNSYQKRADAIRENFFNIDNFLNGNKSLIPADMTLSKEQIRKEINKVFNELGKELENIYGTFVLSKKSLGSGGTSTVKGFTLKDTSNEYAIKFLEDNIAKGHSTQFKRFKQAHLNIIKLQSEGIILPQIHMDKLEISSDLIVPYIIMPVAACTLKDYIKEKKESNKFSISDFEEVFNNLSIAINIMHQNGIIHRDLKPENIFLYNESLLIGDFDIAKFNDSSHVNFVDTKKGDRMGNFSYSAPEQSSKNYNEITNAADWFAFGQILYWLITGDVKKGTDPINFSSYGKEYKKYETLVETLLRDEPSSRPQNIQHIMEMTKKKISKEDSINKFDNFLNKYTVGLNIHENNFIAIEKEEDITDFIQTISREGEDFQLWYCKGNEDLDIIKFETSDESPKILRVKKDFSDILEISIKRIIIYKSPYGYGGNLFALETSVLKSIFNKQAFGLDYEYYKEYLGKKYKENSIKDGWGLQDDGTRIKLDGSEYGVERILNETVLFFATKHGFVNNFDLLSKIHNKFDKYLSVEDNYKEFKYLRRPEWIRDLG